MKICAKQHVQATIDVYFALTSRVGTVPGSNIEQYRTSQLYTFKRNCETDANNKDVIITATLVSEYACLLYILLYFNSVN